MTSKKNVNKPTVKKREKLLLFKFFTASTQSAGNRNIMGINTNVCAKNVRLLEIKVLFFGSLDKLYLWSDVLPTAKKAIKKPAQRRQTNLPRRFSYRPYRSFSDYFLL